MTITLINPNNVTQMGDFFGTGIPYMPITLAYAAAVIRKSGHPLSVIDAFGEAATTKRREDGFIIQGLTPAEVTERIPADTSLILIHAGHVVEHRAIIEIIKSIRRRTHTPIAIIENSQAVTAYSLIKAKDEFFEANADFLIVGEPEHTVLELIERLGEKNPRFEGI